MKTKLKLTMQEEDFICWEESYYRDNVRKDWRRAGRYAWHQAIKQFHRLAKFNCPIP